MSVLPIGFGSSGGIDTGDIPASLRFRRSASASITTSTNPATTSTYFCVFKQGALDAINPIFDGNIKINANNTITAFGLTTTAVARDPTSFHWIHVSNNGLVFDGVNLGAVTTSAITGLRLGYDGTNYADMYGARMCVVSGTSLPYTDFVAFNTTINEWVVKSKSTIKALVDAGDAESSMYEFDDATSLTTLGYDESSKANNATLNNFSLTAGTTYDHMLDVPGNSFAVGNGIWKDSSLTLAGGNLNVTAGSSSNGLALGTIAFDIGAAEEWYWEVTVNSGSSMWAGGVASINLATPNYTALATGNSYAYSNGAQKYNGQTASSYGTGYGATDVIGVKAGNGAITFYNNTASQGVAFSGLSGTFVPMLLLNATGTGSLSLNYGQLPFINKSTNAPTALALCQANLEEPAILNPEDHHVDIAVTKSGDTNFTLPWDADTYDTFFEIKRRDAAGDWYQIDGLRGYTKILKSNSTAAETTDANVLGISGTTGTLKSTLADGTYIVSTTKAGLSASRQTNTDGSITSTVSRNVDSGFAIVTWTGTEANGTVGHGLGAAVKMLTARRRNNGVNWYVYHSALAAGNILLLNTTQAQTSVPTAFNSGTPTSTTFPVGADTTTNASGGLQWAICYADSAIQKSFSYTGNASTDGAYADVGFKMSRALLKCSSTTGNWTVLDSERSTSNVADDVIYENLTNAEATSALADLNSRAIKFRITTDPNSAQTFIGHAWAAVTGKYSLSR